MGKDYNVVPCSDGASASPAVDLSKPRASFCMGLRLPIAVLLVAGIVIYTIGGIICGFTYKMTANTIGRNCSYASSVPPSEMLTEIYGIQSRLAVVGPAFMSFGTGILIVVILQWCCCRPLITTT